MKKAVELAQKLNKAFREMNDYWGENNEHISHLYSNGLYPFDSPFDELGHSVSGWVGRIEELGINYSDLISEYIYKKRQITYKEKYRLFYDNMSGSLMLGDMGNDENIIGVTPFWEDTKGIAVSIEIGVNYLEAVIDCDKPTTNEEMILFNEKYQSVFIPMIIAMYEAFSDSIDIKIQKLVLNTLS
jgi:hypothetical protein